MQAFLGIVFHFVGGFADEGWKLAVGAVFTFLGIIFMDVNAAMARLKCQLKQVMEQVCYKLIDVSKIFGQVIRVDRQKLCFKKLYYHE